LEPLANLGLWGDGDEIWAIGDGFERIGLEVPKDDAHLWYTIGDLWQSALRAKPQLALDPTAWDSFRQGLSEETAVDWSRVTGETKILDGRGYSVIQRLRTTVREWLGYA
jgi:hypothetical protein